MILQNMLDHKQISGGRQAGIIQFGAATGQSAAHSKTKQQ